MTDANSSAPARILVAIDIAKAKHDVLVELPTGKRKKMIVRNQLSDFRQLAAYLTSQAGECEIALEPTADYHRNLAYYLKTQGFDVRSVSSIAVARTREALHNSWDKNDPKDAQVILHLLRNGNTQRFYDPVIEQTNDLQELSKTHFQVSLRKTRLQHSLMNHYLPLYFPRGRTSAVHDPRRLVRAPAHRLSDASFHHRALGNRVRRHRGSAGSHQALEGSRSALATC